MIDFPMTDLLDDAACTAWLERHLHPEGLVCPHCGNSDRRFFRVQTLGSGSVIRRPRRSVTKLSRKMCRAAAPSSIQMSGRAIAAACPTIGRSATALGSGRAMTMVTGNGRCIAIPAKERVRRCARICGCFAVSIRRICIATSPPTRRWSTPNGSPWTCLSGCALPILQCLRA